MLLPLQGALFIASYTQGVALGYVLMPLRGVSTHLTKEHKIAVNALYFRSKRF